MVALHLQVSTFRPSLASQPYFSAYHPSRTLFVRMREEGKNTREPAAFFRVSSVANIINFVRMREEGKIRLVTSASFAEECNNFPRSCRCQLTSA